MPPRSILALATALVLSAATLGCGTMCPPPAASAASGPALAPPAASAAVAKPPESHHVYKLDFVVAPGGAYSLTVEEQKNAEIHVGTNVPLQTTGSTTMMVPRQDVGLAIKCSFTTIGDDLLLHTNLEMSSVDEAATPGPVPIHKLTTAGDAVVTPGKSVVINSIEDPQGHKHYQLTVTATKLR